MTRGHWLAAAILLATHADARRQQPPHEENVPAPELEDLGLLLVQARGPHQLFLDGTLVGQGDSSSLHRLEVSPGDHELRAVNGDRTDTVSVHVREARVTVAALRPRAPDEPDEIVKLFLGGPTPPKLVVHPGPQLPAKMLRLRLGGVVALRVIVETDGDVMVTDVLESSPYLDEPAIGAVMNWKYEPALLDGRPVASTLVVRVKFDVNR